MLPLSPMSDGDADGEAVLLVAQHDDVLTITLNRPEQGNSLNTELVEALGFAVQQASNPSVRAVVITGAGRSFCSGVDIRSPRRPPGAPADCARSSTPTCSPSRACRSR